MHVLLICKEEIYIVCDLLRYDIRNDRNYSRYSRLYFEDYPLNLTKHYGRLLICAEGHMFVKETRTF